MAKVKKSLPILLVLSIVGSAPQLYSQGTSMEGITNSASFGITYGTMHSAFKKDLKFDVGVEMVVDAAVDMLKGSVEEAQRLQMNPRLFIDAVVSGVELSITENSKAVDLQAREEKILYDRVMSALREQIALMGSVALDTTQPPVEPPSPPVEQPELPVAPPVEPPQPEPEPEKPPRPVIPRRTDGYYLNTFLHFGFADEAGFAGPNNTRIEIDPGTTWGYGLAVGLHRSEDTRVELEASWKGSSAKANTKGASDLEIGYYSLMINAYKEYEAPFVDTLDVFAGLGLGWSVASLDGDVSDYSVFGNIPESGDLSFAYQFIFGADYQITDRLSAILAYRLFNTASFNGYNPDVVHLIEMAIRMEL